MPFRCAESGDCRSQSPSAAQKNSVRTQGAASTFTAPAIIITSDAITACTSPAWRARATPLPWAAPPQLAPVASVIRVKDYEEALANDTPFGLSAGIATTSLKHATHFKRHSQAGMVMVNLLTAGVDYHVPFGGRK